MSGQLPASGTVMVRDAFVSGATCQALLDDIDFVWWTPSGTISRTAAGALIGRLSICRTSMGSTEDWLGEAARRALRRIENRLAAIAGLDPACLDPWQIVRYRRGELFEEHHDAGLFADSEHGERVATLLLYLDDQPGDSGATVFPALQRRIAPRAGRLLLWRNLADDGSIDARMRHAGAPARRTKTLLTTWLRQRPVRL